MDFLARREYGQTELIKKLADKGYDRSVAEQAVRKLTEDGLQSDQRFTDAFVQSRINQGKGPVRIRLDLGQRGVGMLLSSLRLRNLQLTGSNSPVMSACENSVAVNRQTSRPR